MWLRFDVWKAAGDSSDKRFRQLERKSSTKLRLSKRWSLQPTTVFPGNLSYLNDQTSFCNTELGKSFNDTLISLRNERIKAIEIILVQRRRNSIGRFPRNASFAR